MGAWCLVSQDMSESWSLLLERRLETSVLRSADPGGSRHMSKAPPDFQAPPDLHQAASLSNSHFQFLFQR